MPSFREFALDLIGRNPALCSNPNAQEMLNVIKSGDSARGEQIARNICDTYGVDPSEAFGRARRFFNL